MQIKAHTKFPPSQVAATIVLSLCIALAGCGGGSGSSALPNDLEAAAPSAGGAVAKGIIINGIVVANELDASGNVLRNVGSVNTDASGNYQITIDSAYAGGPIDFMLTADTATMVCDIEPDCGPRTDSLTDPNSNATVDFGEEMSLPSNFAMEALVGKANKGDVLSVNITPFTTMAAARARAASPLNASAVNNANNVVSQLLGGLDILSVKPVNLADTAAVAGADSGQIIYAALAAGIGGLAFGAGGSGDLETTLSELNNSFSDGSIDADSSVPNTFSLQDIVTAASNQLAAQGLSDNTGILTAMQLNITQNAGSAINPIPSFNLGSPDIVKARALVQDIRTWGTTLVGLANPSSTFYADINSTTELAKPLMGSLSNSLSTAIEILSTTLVNNSSATGSFNYDASTLGSSGTGTVTVSSSGGTLTVNIAGSISTETVNLTTTLPVPSGSTLSSLTMTLTGSIATTDTNNPGISLTINSGTTLTAQLNPMVSLNDSLTTSPACDNCVSAASVALNATLAQINITDPLSFTGLIGFSMQRVTSGTLVDFNPSAANFSGTLTKGSNSFKTTMNAIVSNAGSYSPFIPDSPTNNLTGTLSVGVTLDLAGHPSTQLTLTANKTGLSSGIQQALGTSTLILANEAGTTRVTFSQDSANADVGTMKFTNTNHASMTLSFGAPNITGTITVGSTTVGTVTKLDNGIIKISYSDGTFETLN